MGLGAERAGQAAHEVPSDVRVVGVFELGNLGLIDARELAEFRLGQPAQLAYFAQRHKVGEYRRQTVWLSTTRGVYRASRGIFGGWA